MEKPSHAHATYSRNLGILYDAPNNSPAMRHAAANLLAMSQSAQVIRRTPELAFRAAAGVAFQYPPAAPQFADAITSLQSLSMNSAMSPHWAERARAAAVEYNAMHTRVGHASTTPDLQLVAKPDMAPANQDMVHTATARRQLQHD